MTELKIIEIALGIVGVVSLIELVVLVNLKAQADETEDMLVKLGNIVMDKEMKKMVENLHAGLENLFNPKDEPKKDDKNKLKNNRRTA